MELEMVAGNVEMELRETERIADPVEESIWSVSGNCGSMLSWTCC